LADRRGVLNHLNDKHQCCPVNIVRIWAHTADANPNVLSINSWIGNSRKNVFDVCRSPERASDIFGSMTDGGNV